MKLIKYYTDHHDVDEDFRSVIIQGGKRSDANAVGMMFRHMSDSPNDGFATIASSDI